jgi:hypothetical protein
MAAQALNYEVMAAEEIEVTPEMIRAVLSHLGRQNGSNGGRSAAKNMTPEERRERSRKANAARWPNGKKVK